MSDLNQDLDPESHFFGVHVILWWTSEFLTALVKKCSLSGFLVVNDGWKAYGKLSMEEYHHNVLSHSEN